MIRPRPYGEDKAELGQWATPALLSCTVGGPVVCAPCLPSSPPDLTVNPLPPPSLLSQREASSLKTGFPHIPPITAGCSLSSFSLSGSFCHGIGALILIHP